MTDGQTPTDPQQLREEIEHTRAELGETVQSLAAKADVKARAKDAAAAAGDRARQKAVAAASVVKDQAAVAAGTVKGQASAAADVVKDQASSAAGAVKGALADGDDPYGAARRPLPLAAIGAGVVVLIGVIVFIARREEVMSGTAVKIAYKPVGLLLGAGAGLISGVVFKQVWRLVGHDDDAPNATDEDRGWGEVLLAAAVQGMIFALVKAAVDRGGAVGVRKATGQWPD